MCDKTIIIGSEISNINEILSTSEISQIMNEKLLTICKYNKTNFVHGEKVELFCEIKNIKSLTIKVFEFCSENYYLQNLKEIDSQINLDGLIPGEEISFEFNEPPFQKHTKVFNFEKI